MSIFRKRSPEVIRKGDSTQATDPRATDRQVTEERKWLGVGRDRVEIRRVKPVPVKPTPAEREDRRPPKSTSQDRRSGQRSRDRRNDEEIIIPIESTRKQMLVRVKPHQIQVVVLEGPVLVEHYVANSDSTSLVGNIYLGKVRNVLAGMEAAFVDFGVAKNGVVYVADLKLDNAKNKGKVRIEDLLKEGDEILVQVVKDPIGAKGARLTGLPSLPGRYLVLVPDSDTQGISRRLPDNERTRLREAITAVKPEGFGVIVRTAALHASDEEIAADIHRLLDSWEQIQKEAVGGGGPRPVYREPDLLIRVIREHFTGDFRRMMVDDPDAHEEVLGYLAATAPDLVAKVARYEDEIPLFERYHVEDQLRKALDRRVYLPSGGHLVMDRTEALTVIDVNTGRFVGSTSLEETVLQNNLEAAEELSRQLRLRDIGGIIVIDFIDMESEENQQAVLRRLKESLAKDKTRTQVFEVSRLGLVEMTRKKVSAGLIETFSEPCSACDGRGLVLHDRAATHAIPLLASEIAD